MQKNLAERNRARADSANSIKEPENNLRHIFITNSPPWSGLNAALTPTNEEKKILKYAKGFRWGRKSKERLAREALLHAWHHAFSGRKEKKQDYRTLWQIQLGATARMHNLSYSKLIAGLKKKNITLDRKILAELAQKHPDVFKEIITLIK